jgi:hypothetical protein
MDFELGCAPTVGVPEVAFLGELLMLPGMAGRVVPLPLVMAAPASVLFAEPAGVVDDNLLDDKLGGLLSDPSLLSPSAWSGASVTCATISRWCFEYRLGMRN